MGGGGGGARGRPRLCGRRGAGRARRPSTPFARLADAPSPAPACPKQTGASILEALAAQREAIQRSRDRLAATDADLSASQRALARMASWMPWARRQD